VSGGSNASRPAIIVALILGIAVWVGLFLVGFPFWVLDLLSLGPILFAVAGWRTRPDEGPWPRDGGGSPKDFWPLLVVMVVVFGIALSVALYGWIKSM
jgi:hypothetical protein